MSDPPRRRIRWGSARRIIATRHPPIDIFEDLLDPEDWEAAVALESKTNARIADSVGRLDLVPVQRRVAGHGASYVMSPFTHVSADRPGRFHDGTYGAYYAAKTFDTAVAETVFHQSRFFRATRQDAGWFSQFRELVGKVDNTFHDVRRSNAYADCHDPDSWDAAQQLGRRLRAAASHGIVYNSVRHQGGECLAAFWPDVISPPRQSRTLAYHFDGVRIDVVRDESNGALFRVVD